MHGGIYIEYKKEQLKSGSTKNQYSQNSSFHYSCKIFNSIKEGDLLM